MSLGEFDASGRRKPVPMEDDFLTVDADQVIVAIGQATDLAFATQNGDVNVSKRGFVEIETGTRTRASEAMIFAGGDVVTGPDTVIGAIAAGQKAAVEIDTAIRENNGEPAYIPPPQEEIEIPKVIEEIPDRPREIMPEASAAERVRDFSEVELGFSKEATLTEACRCLRCDLSEEEEA